MPADLYSEVRSIALPTVFGWLGIDLSQFKTRKGGSEKYGKCFFHGAKGNNTSLSFTDDLAHCFSCNVKFRGAIDAVKLVRQCGFQEAVAFLQDRSTALPTKVPPNEKSPAGGHSSDDDAKRLSIVNGVASNGGGSSTPQRIVGTDPRTSTSLLTPLTAQYHKFAVACPWLEERVPDAGIREKYGIFCYDNPKRKSAYSGRVMLPVKDIEGILYGYLGRAIAGNTNTTPSVSLAESPPKYLFPKNLPKSRFLFGAHELWEGRPHRKLFLLESPFCVMRFASLGLPAVSCYGWSVSQEQTTLLQQLCKGVVYLPDRNKWDMRHSALQELSQALWVRCPPLPPGCDDPEQLTLTQIHAL